MGTSATRWATCCRPGHALNAPRALGMVAWDAVRVRLRLLDRRRLLDLGGVRPPPWPASAPPLDWLRSLPGLGAAAVGGASTSLSFWWLSTDADAGTASGSGRSARGRRVVLESMAQAAQGTRGPAMAAPRTGGGYAVGSAPMQGRARTYSMPRVRWLAGEPHAPSRGRLTLSAAQQQLLGPVCPCAGARYTSQTCTHQRRGRWSRSFTV